MSAIGAKQTVGGWRLCTLGGHQFASFCSAWLSCPGMSLANRKLIVPALSTTMVSTGSPEGPRLSLKELILKAATNC